MTSEPAAANPKAEGLVRPARRPPDWRPPGPPAATPADRPEVWPAAGEDLCWLAGDWRILQRLDGHRWSLDDLVTAWWATRCLDAPPASAVDLGSGIGTVLLLLAWFFPAARVTGIEAQAVSAELARRSLAFNGADARCAIRRGDFRDERVRAGLAGADLVTGTPPYLPPGTGTESTRPQCGPCRFEHRGGAEEYARAAAELLAPSAPFVACAAAHQRERVEAAARSAGLGLESWKDVVPRAGKAPLFAAYSMRRQAAATPRADESPLVVRDALGRWTDEFLELRRALGLPPRPDGVVG